MSENPQNLEHHPANSGHPVVVFDGVCNLCNGTVDMLVRLDRHRVLRFASNQSAIGSELINARSASGAVDSIYFVERDRTSSESSAVLAIAKHLPLPWKALVVGAVIPRPIRDWLYRVVAKNRYRWFGKRDTCRLPTPEERNLFLG